MGGGLRRVDMVGYHETFTILRVPVPICLIVCQTFVRLFVRSRVACTPLPPPLPAVQRDEPPRTN